MALNTALKLAILESGFTQMEVANEVSKQPGLKLHESQLSKITRGHMDPSDDIKKALAKVLRKRVAQIFPEVAA